MGFGWNGRASRMLVALAVLAMLGGCLHGCAGKQLIQLSQTPQDKADSLVKIFAEYQTAAANLMERPTISAREKRGIVRANRVAAPAATAILDASDEYALAKARIDEIRASGGTPDDVALQSFSAALSALEAVLRKNEGAILSFKTKVSRAQS